MIFAIKPFEIHDGDGIRTTIFFKGCPLKCKWCHNPESLSFERQILYDDSICINCGKCAGICDANIIQDGKHIFFREKCNLCGKCTNICQKKAFEISGGDMTAEEIAKEVLKDEIFIKGSGGGVTFSGGEPLVQVDFCVKIAKNLKEHNINIAVDTSGFVSRDTLDKIIPYTDTFLFDIKAIDEDVHIACTGVSNKLILENIKYVSSLGIPMEIRYPYIPSMNDNQVEKISEFVKSLKPVKALRVLPYHNFAEKKYNILGLDYPLPDILPPAEDEITRVRKKIEQYGINCPY